jgi:hypothetical protein
VKLLASEVGICFTDLMYMIMFNLIRKVKVKVKIKVKVKVRQSRYRPGVTQRVPGS